MDLQKKQLAEKLKHLEFIESTIARMAECSFKLKEWAVVLTTATLGAFAAVRGAGTINVPWWMLALVLVGPLVIFWGLDAYYLQQERKFRALYDGVIRYPDEGVPKPLSMATRDYGGNGCSWLETVFSKTEVVYYMLLIVFAGLASKMMVG